MRRSIFLLCAIGVACGGSVTSVDGNKSTATLTPADENQLCTDVYDYMKSSFSPADMARLACGFSSTTDTTTTTCQNDFSACVTEQTATMSTAMNGAPDCTAFQQQVAACNTTVATYTKCLVQEIDAMKSLESQFPLCTPGAAQSAELQAMSKLSADCLALMQTCQVVAVGGSGSSGGGGLPDGG
jgi:hypothetical protein